MVSQRPSPVISLFDCGYTIDPKWSDTTVMAPWSRKCSTTQNVKLPLKLWVMVSIWRHGFPEYLDVKNTKIYNTSITGVYFPLLIDHVIIHKIWQLKALVFVFMDAKIYNHMYMFSEVVYILREENLCVLIWLIFVPWMGSISQCSRACGAIVWTPPRLIPYLGFNSM